MNNTTTDDQRQQAYDDFTRPEIVVLYAAGLLVAAVGMFLDIVTLHVLRVAKFSGRKVVRLTLASLCCADLLLSATTIIINVSHYSEIPLILSGDMEGRRNAYCWRHCAELFWAVGVHANLLTLVVMAAEQVVSVRWPFWSEKWLSPRRVGSVLAVAWAASFIIGFVVPAAAETITAEHAATENWVTKGTTRFCYQAILYDVLSQGSYVYDFGQSKFKLSMISVNISLMLIAFLALLTAYSYMFFVVRRLVMSEANMMPNAAKYPSPAAWRGSRRIVTATLAVTLMFLAFYLPLFVYNVIRVLVGPPESQLLYPALFAITALTTVGDPLVYAWRLKEVRGGFAALVRGRQRQLARPAMGGKAAREPRDPAQSGDKTSSDMPLLPQTSVAANSTLDSCTVSSDYV